jgi:hypothetical protein
MTVLGPNQREDKGTWITQICRILVGKRNLAAAVSDLR